MRPRQLISRVNDLCNRKISQTYPCGKTHWADRRSFPPLQAARVGIQLCSVQRCWISRYWHYFRSMIASRLDSEITNLVAWNPLHRSKRNKMLHVQRDPAVFCHRLKKSGNAPLETRLELDNDLTAQSPACWETTDHWLKTSSSKLKTNPKLHGTRSVGNDTTATDPNSKGYSKVDWKPSTGAGIDGSWPFSKADPSRTGRDPFWTWNPNPKLVRITYTGNHRQTCIVRPINDLYRRINVTELRDGVTCCQNGALQS